MSCRKYTFNNFIFIFLKYKENELKKIHKVLIQIPFHQPNSSVLMSFAWIWWNGDENGTLIYIWITFCGLKQGCDKRSMLVFFFSNSLPAVFFCNWLELSYTMIISDYQHTLASGNLTSLLASSDQQLG